MKLLEAHFEQKLATHFRGSREKAGMSIKELARQARSSEKTIQRIENGEKNIKRSTYYRVAKVLGIDLDNLSESSTTNLQSHEHQPPEQSSFECPHCLTLIDVARGAKICTGCHGEVIYGATTEEMKNGAIAGGLLALMLMASIWDTSELLGVWWAPLASMGLAAFLGMATVATTMMGKIRVFLKLDHQ